MRQQNCWTWLQNVRYYPFPSNVLFRSIYKTASRAGISSHIRINGFGTRICRSQLDLYGLQQYLFNMAIIQFYYMCQNYGHFCNRPFKPWIKLQNLIRNGTYAQSFNIAKIVTTLKGPWYDLHLNWINVPNVVISNYSHYKGAFINNCLGVGR
jgi:hypothetical protein